MRDSGGLEGSTAITRARRILDTEILLMRETAAPKIVQLLEVSAGEVPNYNLKNVHVRFSWYKFKTEDVYKTLTGPCFQVCTTEILNGPGKQF